MPNLILSRIWNASKLPTNWFTRQVQNYQLNQKLKEKIKEIIEDVTKNGDNALLELTKRYDKVVLSKKDMDEMKEGQLDGYRVYRRRWHAKIGGTVNDGIVGDKNIYSTTEDMMKWVQGLNSGKIISKKTLEEMYTRGETKYKRKVPYGFGFRIKEDDKGKVVYHNGKWNGFSTSLMQYTDEDLVVVTLEHSNYNSMKTLNQKIKKIVDQNFNLPVE